MFSSHIHRYILRNPYNSFTRSLTLFARLEEMNEKRTSMIGKLKSVEKEVEGLAVRKEVAEAYLSKQVRSPDRGQTTSRLCGAVGELCDPCCRLNGPAVT